MLAPRLPLDVAGARSALCAAPAPSTVVVRWRQLCDGKRPPRLDSPTAGPTAAIRPLGDDMPASLMLVSLIPHCGSSQAGNDHASLRARGSTPFRYSLSPRCWRLQHHHWQVCHVCPRHEGRLGSRGELPRAQAYSILIEAEGGSSENRLRDGLTWKRQNSAVDADLAVSRGGGAQARRLLRGSTPDPIDSGCR